MPWRKTASRLVTLVTLFTLVTAATAPAEDKASLSRAGVCDRQARALFKKGCYGEALPLSRQALAIAEKTLGAENPEIVPYLFQLAKLYRQMGNYALAEPLYKRALAIREKALGTEHPDTARILAKLGMFYRSRGDHAQAEHYMKRALAIREKDPGPRHQDTARSLDDLAKLYRSTGNYEKAEALYLRALSIKESTLGPEDPSTAVTLSNLAFLYKFMGNYAEAERMNKRALAIKEKKLGTDNKSTAVSINNLGRLYMAMGAYEMAEPLFKRALAIKEKILSSEDPSMANGLHNLAMVRQAMGDYVRAEQLFKQALDIRRKVQGPMHLDTASSLNSLALLHAEMQDFDQAETYFKQALAIREKVLRPGHPTTARGYNDLARLYLARGDLSQAKSRAKQALAMAEGSHAPELVIAVNDTLRAILAKEGDLDAAIFFGKRAVNAAQTQRRNLADMDEALRDSYRDIRAGMYRALADLLIARDRRDEAQQVLSMLKEQEYSEFLQGGAQAARKMTVSLTEAEERAGEAYVRTSASLVSLGRELAELGEISCEARTEAQQARLKELESILDGAHAEFQQALVAIEAGFKAQGESRVVEFGEKKINNGLRTIVQRMGAGAILVHYLVLPDSLRILVTTPEVIQVRTVAIKEPELNRLVESFREALQDPARDPSPAARKLHALLIEPIEADLREAKTETIMASLDGNLRYIPLAALENGHAYLAERYAVDVFTDAARDKMTASSGKPWKIACFGVSEEHPPFKALTAVPLEIQGILGDPVDQNDGVLPGTEYMDRKFTRGSFRDALRARFPVLHIASHFRFEPNDSLASFLLLGGVEGGSASPASPGGDDPRGNLHLSLREIKKYDYYMGDVDLLTLSACETAMGGKGSDGREVESLGVLAQEKGASSVLATLWPVADASTGAFMQAFYTLHQQEGLSKAEALRRAQLLFIQGKVTPASDHANRGVAVLAGGGKNAPPVPPPGDYRHPFYWAPFILMGNWK